MIALTQEKREELANYARSRLASHVVHGGCSDEEDIFKIALASLTAQPEFYVVVTSAGVWQSFKKCRAEAEFIISRPFNPNYKIVEIFTTPSVPEISIPDTDIFNQLSGEMMQKSLDSNGKVAKTYSEAAHKIALAAKEFRDQLKSSCGC